MNTKHFPLNLQSGLTLTNFRDVGLGLKSETRYATARQCVLKETFYNKLQPYENTAKYKRISRRRFFLLMRWRTPPISSEFRGAFETPPPVRHCCELMVELCMTCEYLMRCRKADGKSVMVRNVHNVILTCGRSFES